MGQKVNPNGLRYGIYRNWESRWFVKDGNYAPLLEEDWNIQNFIEKELKNAMVSRIEIERTNSFEGKVKVNVAIFTAKPGAVIGQEGKNINALKKDLEKIVKSGELEVKVVEIKKPDMEAKLIAQEIATMLENRASFRSAQKRTIARVRRSGAKGIKTLVSGRLNGAEIARSEGYKDGIIPLHTLKSDIDYASVEAHTTYGRLGVKVWICRGEYDVKKKGDKQ
ncbi:MAG: 30S ribosomal protein S3 [Bacilli bacterium]|jgi:small subunit ribosomal protein S3